MKPIGLLLGVALGSASAQTEPAPARVLEHSALQAYRCPAVPYPVRALRKGVQGDVWVRWVVGDDGRFDALSVDQSAGDTPEHGLLDRASLQQLGRCQHVGPGAPLAPGTYRTRLSWRIDG